MERSLCMTFTNKISLKSIDELIPLFKSASNFGKNGFPILLVGGKSDLNNKRTVSYNDAIKYLKSYNLYEFIECSALTGQNVEKIFNNLTLAIMKKAGYI